jgi:hypothetical protein
VVILAAEAVVGALLVADPIAACLAEVAALGWIEWRRILSILLEPLAAQMTRKGGTAQCR